MRSLLYCLAALSMAAVGYGTSPKLPVDPAITEFKLENGLRCWVMPHKTPPGKVAMWLHVGSGSLNENESQRGLAHFLEHMAFNGTKHFPPGELLKYFESIGLTFGHHQNAFTSYDQTTYTLTLPKNSNEIVEKGLLCLSDYAFRMSLLPEEVKREAGVVLEEMRARDGLSNRMFEKKFPAYFPGSRVATRRPIGSKEVIERADPKQVRAYYEKWYRPEMCTLIIVGDITVKQVKPMIEKQFAAWTASPDKPKPYETGIKTYTSERGAIITDPEQKVAEITLMSIEKGDVVFTEAGHRGELVDDLGTWIFSRRLQTMIKEGKAPFQSASSGKGYMFATAYYSMIQASGEPGKAKEIIRAVARETERARKLGFHPQELKQAIAAKISGLERAVKTEPTRNSGSIIRTLNFYTDLNYLPLSAEQNLQISSRLLKTIKLEEVNAVFRKNFPQKKRLVMAALPEGHKTGLTDASLLKLVQNTEAEKVEEHKVAAEVTSLLPQKPKAGKLENVTTDKETGIVSGTLSNGVRLHFRKMDYKKNQVWVKLSIAGGSIQETAATKGLTTVAARAFAQLATSKLSSTQISDFISDKKVGVSGGMQDDCLTLAISGSPEDLELGFQLAYLIMTDVKIEEAGVTNWLNQFRMQYTMMQTRAEGRLFEAFPKLVTPDVRFHSLTPMEAEKIKIGDAQAWLHNILKTMPIEMSIVGDIEQEKAIALAETYIGSLPKRSADLRGMDKLREVMTNNGPIEKKIEVNSIAHRSAVLVAWKTAGREDKRSIAIQNLARSILQKKVREEIREKRGWTYSSSVFPQVSKSYNNRSAFACYFTADPDKARKALDVAKGIILDFAKTGPTDEELAVAKKQIATVVEKTMKEPGFWSGNLAKLEYQGYDLAYLKTVMKRYEDVSVADIKAFLQKYLTDANRLEIISGSAPKPVKQK